MSAVPRLRRGGGTSATSCRLHRRTLWSYEHEGPDQPAVPIRRKVPTRQVAQPYPETFEPLSDDQLDEIARAADVPEQYRGTLEGNLQDIISDWKSNLSHRWEFLGGHPYDLVSGLRENRELRQSNKRKRRVAGEFVRMLEEERVMMWLDDRSPEEMTPWLVKLQNAVDVAKEIAAGEHDLSFPRRRGGKHRELHILIADLDLAIVELAKGKLTFWRDKRTGEVTGPLPKVLKILRPHLPRGVVPARLSEKMLQRARAAAGAIKKRLAAEEAKQRRAAKADKTRR